VYLTRALKADGVPTVPSRWLLRLAAVTRHASLDQPQWRHWRQAMQHAGAHAPAAPPAPTPPVEARPSGLSVTDVERWMRDPYALYAKKILRLFPLDPIDAELGAAERGTLIHQVFEDFLKEEDWREDRLIALADKALAEATARPLLRVLWRPRFRHLARWFVDRLNADAAAGRRPIFTERYEQWPFDVDGTPFTLTAKADRIDAAPDGIVIVDYKTGSIPKKKQIEAGYAPQLPLEALMAEGGAFGQAVRQVAGLEFWQMKGTTTPAEVMEVKTFQDRVAQARDGLTTMVRTFRDEATPYLSQPRPEEAKGDDYDHLARVKEWRGGGGA
jgi:ATP-dependent helicase/nuclease subunit B